MEVWIFLRYCTMLNGSIRVCYNSNRLFTYLFIFASGFLHGKVLSFCPTLHVYTKLH